jgi:TldD protein
MRADGWNRLPLVRMTNVSLDNGAIEFDQLLSGIDRGIYVETNKSWSIDDRRLNFQFATEFAREIVGGRLGKLLKNPIYYGIGPEFWASLEALDKNGIHWGLPNCGKGQPVQTAHVGHTAPAGRFRKVKVGCAK